MANTVRLQLYVDQGGSYRWRLIAGNGEKVAASEAYSTYASAKRSAENVKAWADVAVITDYPD